MPANVTEAPPRRYGKVATPTAVIEPVRPHGSGEQPDRGSGHCHSDEATKATTAAAVLYKCIGGWRARRVNTYAAGCKFEPTNRIL